MMMSRNFDQLEIKRPSNRESDSDVEQIAEEFRKNKFIPSAKVVRINKDQSQEHNQAFDDVESHDETKMVFEEVPVAAVPVLGDIIERNVELCCPLPKENVKSSVNVFDFKSRRKRSIFVEEMEQFSSFKLPAETARPKPDSYNTTFTGSFVIDGSGLSSSECHSDVQKIHEENLNKLSKMSADEVLQKKQEILEELGKGENGKNIINFLQSRRKGQGGSMKSTENRNTLSGDPAEKILKMSDSTDQDALLLQDIEKKRIPVPTVSTVKTEPLSSDVAELHEEELPIKSQEAGQWLHMDKVEMAKLAWMTMLPEPKPIDVKSGHPARFDFQGNLLSRDASIPTQHGLHHHASEPEIPGYAIEELFLLARSSVQSQRISALEILAHILQKYWDGTFDGCFEASLLNTMLESGLVPLLRWALDDTSVPSIAAAVSAIHHLLVCNTDELCLDWTGCWTRENILPFFCAPCDEPIDVDHSELTDASIIKLDVIKGFLRMDLLPRFKYIVRTLCPPPAVCQLIIEICIRLARHSEESASKILSDTPELMDIIFKKFLPLTWCCSSLVAMTENCSFPMPSALKLVRVMAATNRDLALSLIQKYPLTNSLKCYVSLDPSDGKLPPKDMHIIFIESLRTWRTFLDYGFCGEIFLELHPIMVKLLQFCQTISISTDLEKNTQNYDYATHLLRVLASAVALASVNDPSLSSSSHYVSWTAVEPFLKMGELCVQRWLSEFSSATTNLAGMVLLATGLDFIAAFYQKSSVIHKKSTVSWYLLHNMVYKYLLPCLRSEQFGSLSQLCSSSVLLYSGFSGCQRDATVLPSLGSVMWKDDIVPLLNKDSPFPLLTAIAGFLVDSYTFLKQGITAMTKSVPIAIDEVVKLFLNNIFIQNYLREFVNSPVKFSHWFDKCEVMFIGHLVKLSNFVEDDVETDLWYRVAINAISIFKEPFEFYAQEILQYVVVNPMFLHPGRMNELPIFKDRQEKNVREELKTVFQFYLSSYISSQALDQSSYLLQRHPLKLRTSTYRKSASQIFEEDWVFKPILNYYHTFKDKSSLEGLSEEVTKGVIHCLQFICFNSQLKFSAIANVPFFERFYYLCLTFLIDSELFFSKEIQKLLSMCLKCIIEESQPSLNLLNLRSEGLPKFEEIYKELLVQFEAVSYGDETFARFVAYPLQQCYPTVWKLLLLTEHQQAVQFFSIHPSKLAVPIEKYLQPTEKDEELLKVYLHALKSGIISEQRCPLLFIMAMHHLHHFVSQPDNRNSKFRQNLTNVMKLSKPGEILHRILHYHGHQQIGSQ